jgi:hypothetical protein
MENIDILHNQSMDHAENAVLLRLQGKEDDSINAFIASYRLEMEAALQLKGY